MMFGRNCIRLNFPVLCRWILKHLESLASKVCFSQISFPEKNCVTPRVLHQERILSRFSFFLNIFSYIKERLGTAACQSDKADKDLNDIHAGEETL